MLHPTPASIENQKTQVQRFPPEEILLDELLPLGPHLRRHLGISVSGQVNEVELIFHPIEIDDLSTARRRTGEGQPVLAGEAIEQAGFTDVAAAQKCDLREVAG